jgi:hypothetical protein
MSVISLSSWVRLAAPLFRVAALQSLPMYLILKTLRQ